MRKDQSIARLLNMIGLGVLMCPLVFGVGQLRLVSFHDVHQELNRKDFATQVMNKAISGPMKDYHVTLMISSGVSGKTSVADELISSIQVPIYILRLGQKKPIGSDMDFNTFNNSQKLSEGDLDTSKSNEISNYNHMTTSVAVIVTPEEEEEWWPLWNPIDNWAAKGALIVSISSCRLPYLKAPFIERISFVAMVCPYARRGKNVPYKVMTWLPWVLGRKLLDLGTWESDSFHAWDKLFVDRFQDMSAKNLSTYAIDQDEPYVYLYKGKTLKGVNINILDSMSKWLKFQNALDHGITENWYTIGDLLKAGKRDVMINFNTFTLERYRDFDLSVAYYYEGFGLVLEVPRPVPRWQNILQPFSLDVWLAIIISLFAVIFIYHKLNIKYQSSLAVNAVNISQSLLLKPLAIVPESWNIRNFLLIWWIAAWILELSWICNLTAVLTIPKFPVKIQMKEELAESKYRLCMLDYGEFAPNALKTSSETTLAALGRKLDLVPLMLEWQDYGHEGCVSKVIAGTHAQAETFSYIKILYSRLNHSSRVYMLKDQLYPSYLAFRFPKHTPWKYKFDTGMQRLYESGLIQLWVQEAMEDFVQHTVQDRSLSEKEALNLNHLQGSFFLLAFGILLAAVAMGGEVVSSSRKIF